MRSLRLRPGPRRRTAALAALASLPLAALPATAAAADNQPPSRPLISDLATGYEPCAAGDDRPWVGAIPELGAVIHDPDAGPVGVEDVTAQFEVSWQDSTGETQRRLYEQSRQVYPDGRRFEVTPSDLPTESVITWRVRAKDDAAWGPWSSSGGQGYCEFVHDDERPGEPTVSSPEYPDDAEWYDGVGHYGSFTFDSPSPDTAAYRYSFPGKTWRKVEPETLGGPVTVRWVPEGEGPKWVEVRALDRAGNGSAEVRHSFLVGDGRAPVGQWALGGSADAPATVGSGVVFGSSGPSGTGVTRSARLDGTADAYLTGGEPAVDSAKSFAMTAWVRPDTVDRDMVAVGQDGDAGGALSLGLSRGADDAAWSFTLPTADGPVRVEGGNPVAGRWNHLAGVYDPVTRTAELFVNGAFVAKAEGVSAQQTGALQIGRVDGAANWSGALADVRVWDRLVFADVIAGLAHREATRTGYWQLNEVQEGRSPEYAGGQDLVLGGDAHVPVATCDPFTDPTCVPNQWVDTLKLDGEGDFAQTGQPVVDTNDSFTLAAGVRLSEDEPGRDMTVLSLPGENGDLLTLRYAADASSWQLVTAGEDGPADGATLEWRDGSPAWSDGARIAVTYNAADESVRLFVDGRLAGTAAADLGTATGGLQVGRSFTGATWGEYLDGGVDSVRAYEGVLSESEIGFLSVGGENPDL